MAKTSVFTVRAATRNEVYDSLIKTCRAVAQEEASHQNLSNQALMGAKEGNLHLHLRPRVTDPRNPDGDEKGMDEYTLHESNHQCCRSPIGKCVLES